MFGKFKEAKRFKRQTDIFIEASTPTENSSTSLPDEEVTITKSGLHTMVEFSICSQVQRFIKIITECMHNHRTYLFHEFYDMPGVFDSEKQG